MARERWFFAKDNRRMGPFPRRQLVESLLALPDPRSPLVWRHGLPAWIPAAEVPEIERLLAPFAPGKEAAAGREPPAPVGAGPDASGRFEARPAGRPEGRPRTPPRRRAGLGTRTYLAIGLAVLIFVLLGWLL
jgi:GYF domain 2